MVKIRFFSFFNVCKCWLCITSIVCGNDCGEILKNSRLAGKKRRILYSQIPVFLLEQIFSIV